MTERAATAGLVSGRGVAIPAPAAESGMSEAEIARWREDQRILESDPRTSGGANRPAWLVERVLADARKVVAS